MSEAPGEMLRDQMDRDPAKKCHCSELAARVYGLNDQVDDLKELLREMRTLLPSEEDILNYSASSENGQASLAGILVRKIEMKLNEVR